MKTLKTTVCLVAAAMVANAATEVHSWGMLGPHGGFRGSTVYLMATVRWFDAYTATADPTTNRITAPGTNYAVNDTLRFWAADGGTLPNAISSNLPYIVCAKISADTFTVGLANLSGCPVATLGTGPGNAGSGTWKVGKLLAQGAGGDHVYLTNPTLPDGVTIAGCVYGSKSTRQDCPSSTGEYYSYGGEDIPWLILNIASTATVGTNPLSVTFHCRTSTFTGCADQTVTIPFTVDALVPITCVWQLFLAHLRRFILAHSKSLIL